MARVALGQGQQEQLRQCLVAASTFLRGAAHQTAAVRVVHKLGREPVLMRKAMVAREPQIHLVRAAMAAVALLDGAVQQLTRVALVRQVVVM